MKDPTKGCVALIFIAIFVALGAWWAWRLTGTVLGSLCGGALALAICGLAVVITNPRRV